MNIVILGQTISSAQLIEQLRSKDQDCKITVFPFQDPYPCIQSKYADLIAGRAREKEIYYRTRDFFDRQEVQIVNDQKILSVSLFG